MSAELISRLNAKPNQLDAIPGQKGLGLTPQDIAGAIGMSYLPKGASYLVRVKYAFQTEYALDIAICLYQSLSERFNYTKLSKTRSHYPGLILELCKLSVQEFMDSKTCPYCSGTKYVIDDDGLKKQCNQCGGYGVRSGKREDMCWALKIHPKTFTRYYSPMVKEALDLMGRWEQVAIGAIRHHK